MASLPDQPSPPLPADTLAARYLEAFWQARETFAHAIAPVLREEYGLDLRDYGVLRLIERQNCTPSSLADALQLPSYAASRLLEPLSKRAYVERRVDTMDARRYQLFLTSSGQAVIRAIEHRVARLIEHFLEELGAERTELVVSSLEAFGCMNVGESSTRTVKK